MITEEQVKKYQKIYRKNFGINISRKEAYAEGIKLLQLFEIIFKPKDKNSLLKGKNKL